MGKKDADHSHADVDRYRKQLGKQEFKGRSKRNALAIKNQAQLKRSGNSPLKDGLLLIGILVAMVTLIYLFFYFAMVKKEAS